MSIEQALRELVTAIRNSDEYKAFEEAKAGIRGQDEARRQMDVFRAHCYRANNTPAPGDPLADMQEMMQERQEVRKNPAVDRYLTTEMEMCRLLQRVCVEILQVTDMEIDSFSDQI